MNKQVCGRYHHIDQRRRTNGKEAYTSRVLASIGDCGCRRSSGCLRSPYSYSRTTDGGATDYGANPCTTNSHSQTSTDSDTCTSNGYTDARTG
jgi:hypothetical protein